MCKWIRAPNNTQLNQTPVPVRGRTRFLHAEGGHGQADSDRRPVGRHCPAAAGPPAFGPRRPAPHSRSRRADRHPVCLEDRDTVGRPAAGNGLRLRDELLAALARLAARQPRFGQRAFPPLGGTDTGPNPTDRGKSGCTTTQ